MIVDALWEAALRKSVREQMHKVSFGGDRSEAGRYAANQRWKGNTKTEVKTPTSAKAKDITSDLKLYFGNFEMSKGDREIKKRMKKYQLANKASGDVQLEIIAEKQGFAGKPTVVSSEKMKQLEKEGWKIVYRGFKDVFRSDAKGVIPLTAEEHLQQFISGDYWAGLGFYGNGIYFTDDLQVARGYAYFKSGFKGKVLKAAIPPNTVLELEPFMRTVIDKQNKTIHFSGDHDMGRYLAAKGHRAAQVKQDYFLVFDRSMLAVEEGFVVDE